jgi:hypothetical protein
VRYDKQKRCGIKGLGCGNGGLAHHVQGYDKWDFTLLRVFRINGLALAPALLCCG